MNKIIIIGCPGAGKTYFAKKLHNITNLPLYHLDLIWHRKDKTHISREEFDITLTNILQKDKWIIDGDYSRTLELRMQACDTIILFDLDYETCLKGIIQREGTNTDDIPWSNNEMSSILLEQVKNYIPNKLPKVYKLLKKFKNTKEIIIFKSREDAKEWLKKVFSELPL